MPFSKIDFSKKQVCIGNMNKKIILHTKTIKAPTIDSDFSETIEETSEVWSAIKTISKGVDIFDGVNLVGTITHEFYIRYITGITTENYIEYNSQYFKILLVENIGEENNYLVLKSTLRGDTTYKANEV